MVAPSVREVARRGAGRLDVGREAESDVAALLQRVCLLLSEALVVKDFHGLLEGLDRRNVVVRHAIGIEVRHLVAAQQVLATKIHGIQAHLSRGDVEQDLAPEGLKLPWPSIRDQTAGVGEHRLEVEAGLRNPVRAGEVHTDGRLFSTG